ncbi:MAG TPA: MBL fold metallo-hydrolase [Candidatus Enterenecus stercoripullorum]|nr:MBL fold metallo-hydrolase [Candidatus Enterenecus stercoripullorum]
MLKMATLASGSSGNCAVVSDGKVHILLDAGISARRILQGLRELGLEGGQLAGILLTHEHSDHVGGLAVLCRQLNVELYATPGTARQICYRTAGLEDRFRVFDPGEAFALGDLIVGSFATSHDCACPVGYVVTDGRRRLALCTDTGKVTAQAARAIRGSDLLIGEFNYDLDMLRAGSYPASLKERILGDQGHLSNEMGGKLAAWAVEQGTRRVVLAHLSKENNDPETARKAAHQAIEGVGARIGKDVSVSVAPRSENSGWLEV